MNIEAQIDCTTDTENTWQNLAPAYQRELIQTAIAEIILQPNKITMEINKQGLAHIFNAVSSTQVIQNIENDTFTEEITATLKKCRWETQLVFQANNNEDREPEFNNALIRIVVQTQAWRDRLLNGAATTIRELADAVNSTEKYVGSLINIAYLSLEIVEKILAGKQPPELTVRRLRQGFSPIWEEQKIELGFSDAQYSQTPHTKPAQSYSQQWPQRKSQLFWQKEAKQPASCRTIRRHTHPKLLLCRT